MSWTVIIVGFVIASLVVTIFWTLTLLSRDLEQLDCRLVDAELEITRYDSEIDQLQSELEKLQRDFNDS